MLTPSWWFHHRPEFERLPSFLRLGGGGWPLDLQTEQHKKEYNTTEQRGHVTMTSRIPHGVKGVN